ncbi:peptidoglycan-binding protein [Microbacterium sp. HD4P20]|uniref:efflux RND transporter periplasmic adaptor subunit n=1 Tax=Microbacterium sp. HD4P20 TaxID=2864874 RepID=UPI001C644B4A|nr:peptidoglycan-binding protein [Microbacterium sp. HD4P20]MCP2637198.1 peptidoglycan-binding protein [Microbacterium sp. HD4P20]
MAVSTGVLATADQETPRPQIATEPVVRGDLEETTSASGTLRYAGSRTVQAGLSGTVTELPAPGAVVAPGGRLYTIDDTPVFLLPGGLPAWREFASGMDEGADVKQLEQALSDLGFFTDEPDEEFRWATVEAIMDWQESAGLERTGTLPFGSIVFTAGDLRIGTMTANVGDQVAVGAELFPVSDTTQVVEVNLNLSDQQLAVLDTSVVVRLPGGGETSGKIVSVGTPTETDGATGQAVTVIPVVIALDDPESAAAFQEASVTVDIPSQRRDDVLSTPVGALLALTPDQFGVEVMDPDRTTRQVPVETGLFAGGRVEISGEGITEGTEVVVPER